VVESVSNLFTGNENGQVDATDLLKSDHRRVESLFERAKANDYADARGTFDQIRRELEMHTHIEEQIFYPHLLSAGNDDLQKITREALEEHRQAKALLEELEMLTDDQGGFQAKLTVLIEDVEHHVQDEEGEMFPLVKRQIDSETLLCLGTLMDGEKIRFGGSASRTASAR